MEQFINLQKSAKQNVCQFIIRFLNHIFVSEIDHFLGFTFFYKHQELLFIYTRILFLYNLQAASTAEVKLTSHRDALIKIVED